VLNVLARVALSILNYLVSGLSLYRTAPGQAASHPETNSGIKEISRFKIFCNNQAAEIRKTSHAHFAIILPSMLQGAVLHRLQKCNIKNLNDIFYNDI
jgi:hypothetical protein